MWFATPKGLSSLSKDRWHTYRFGDGLPSENVNCLLQDSSGVLWVGTASGLAFRGPNGFQIPKAAAGALTAEVLGLAEDKSGSLWVATATNVLRVQRNKLLLGTSTEDDVRAYGQEDGLRGTRGVKRNRSVVTDPSGRVWFSLDQGISVVDPARLTRDSTPPIVQLQEISADGVSIGVRPPVHVPGGSKRVTISFTGLGLSAPEQVVFRSFLKGFDHSWSETTKERQTGYTNLPPKQYRFLVMARSQNGIWSKTDAAVDFQVDPLYWQTRWFLATCISICVAGIFGIYQFRLHDVTSRLSLRSEERLAERTRIARELHDTLLQGFHGAIFRFQAARNMLPIRPGEAIKALDGALERADQVVAEGRDAVHDLRSSSAVNNDLADALRALADELATLESAGECAKFRLEVEGTPRYLQPTLREEIYQIAREAVRNAFRHSHARRIDAEILYGKNFLRVRVTDDGCGMHTELSGRDAPTTTVCPECANEPGGSAGSWRSGVHRAQVPRSN